MLSRLVPRVPVTRHRGRVRDENGGFTAESSPVVLMAIGVAPGGGTDQTARERTGEDIACTVYFPPGTDVVNGDELTIRGQRFKIVVDDWQLPETSTGGLAVQCVRGQG